MVTWQAEELGSSPGSLWSAGRVRGPIHVLILQILQILQAVAETSHGKGALPLGLRERPRGGRGSGSSGRVLAGRQEGQSSRGQGDPGRSQGCSACRGQKGHQRLLPGASRAHPAGIFTSIPSLDPLGTPALQSRTGRPCDVSRAQGIPRGPPCVCVTLLVGRHGGGGSARPPLWAHLLT